MPGKPEESLIVQAIRYQDEPKMPPEREALAGPRGGDPECRWVEMEPPLGLPFEARVEAAATATTTERTASRIADGARRFWAFQPVKDASLPPIADTSWPKSDIDRYILAALEAKGLKPSPPANRRTLIRRATFDLTGLPPTPGEVDAFLADTAPDAFAGVIDRLLATPQYGERWGRHWLDVVRYADARDARGIGGASDIAEAWRYRDWVVNAFNRDMPYDRFIIDQIAGDLIPAADPSDVECRRARSDGALLTIGEWGTGDADKEKMITDIVDDQIDVVGRASRADRSRAPAATITNSTRSPPPIITVWQGSSSALRIIPEPARKPRARPCSTHHSPPPQLQRRTGTKHRSPSSTHA